MTVPANLAPTFREIMSAAKIDKKSSADGDTWLRIVKPCRVVNNVHALTTSFGGLVDSGAGTCAFYIKNKVPLRLWDHLTELKMV